MSEALKCRHKELKRKIHFELIHFNHCRNKQPHRRCDPEPKSRRCFSNINRTQLWLFRMCRSETKWQTPSLCLDAEKRGNWELFMLSAAKKWNRPFNFRHFFLCAFPSRKLAKQSNLVLWPFDAFSMRPVAVADLFVIFLQHMWKNISRPGSSRFRSHTEIMRIRKKPRKGTDGT